MALLNDDLSVWEIGFRWAGYDPDQVRFRLPLAVRDNFRVLMDAILCDHLYCLTLNSEKYHGEDPLEAQLHIRYWLDDVYACIEGQAYSKKMLKWGRIERFAFQRWCERRNIPLPDFWFSPGWALEYEWEEESLVVSELDGKAGIANLEEVLDGKPTNQDDHAPIDSDTRAVEESPPLHDIQAESESSKKLRENQRITITCQQVAINLWKLHADMTIASMVQHEAIQELCGAKFYAPEVVRRWLSAVAPPEVKQRRGRPKKKTGTEDE